MSDTRAPGPHQFSGIRSETWIIKYDENGKCDSPDTRSACIEAAAAVAGRPIILFSHGWNNDFADATSLYERFLSEFEKTLVVSPLTAGLPLFIGIHWPSIWLPFDKGPTMAGSGPKPSGNAASTIVGMVDNEVDRALFERLLSSATLSVDETRDVARLVAPLLQPSDDEGPSVPQPSQDDVVKMLIAIQNAEGGGYNDLEEIGFLDDGDPGEEREAAAAAYGLNPKNVLRLASLYIMKKRAGTVGAAGVMTLVEDLCRATSAPLHLVGHSFGCKVLLTAIAKSQQLSRKIKSVLLLQPAISYLAFAETIPGRDVQGAFRPVFDKVEQPVVSTYSANDFPLHGVYHHALARANDIGEIGAAPSRTSAGSPPNNYAAMGGYGPRDSGESLLDPIPDAGGIYDFSKGARMIALDGSAARRIGSHGDVATSFTAGALRWQMAGSPSMPAPTA